MDKYPVNILGCCGGHEEHIDSCAMLWDESDWTESELILAKELSSED